MQVAPLAYAEEHDNFRNELSSVTKDGRRRWVYARQPTGRLYRARTVVSVFLVAFLLLAPFITIHGQPLMLLDVLNRRFVIFSTLFVPQDFYLVVILALTVLVTIVLSTVIVGRIWCGWLCPQTIFMEMLFRKLEYAIEGSAEHQLRRDRGTWTAERAVRKSGKHAIFFALSFVIANVFLAWIIGAGPLYRIVTDPPREHLVGLIAISIFSLIFYAVFARFRESGKTVAGKGAVYRVGNFNFGVTVTSGGQTQSRSYSVSVALPPITALTLSFATAPSKQVCYALNVPMTPEIRVKVVDQSGTPRPGITVAMAGITNNGAKVTVTPSSAVSDANGIASFGGPTFNKTGGYSLIASVTSPVAASITSAKFTISPSCP